MKQSNWYAGNKAVPHQRSWALIAQAEKVLASTSNAGVSGQSRLSVQPHDFKVGRLKPAWILAPSNRPTSHTNTRTHIREHTGATSLSGLAVFSKLEKQVRKVRRLDKPSVDAGLRRPTSTTNLIEVGRKTGRQE
jgi:hypothetical protein